MFTTEQECCVKELFYEMGYNYHTMVINKPYYVLDQKYQILSKDGKWEYVEYIIRKPDDFAYSIIYNDEILETSGDHAILCKKCETFEEIYLKVKYIDTVKYQVYYRGNWVLPHIEKTNMKIPIVDFKLSKNHTYESNGFISHNTSFGDPYCIDPYSTKIKIRYKEKEEEITLAEFANRYLEVADFDNPEIYDISNMDIEILSVDSDGKEVYKPILSFIVKDNVESYYTDGKLNGTSNHKIIENGKEIKLENHKDFKKVNEKMAVVDIEVGDTHNYIANGRINHNSTSGGMALKYHSSVRLRLKAVGQIKGKVNDIEQVIGMTCQAQVIKNRCGPPMRKVEFPMYFDRGIDDNESWIEALLSYKMIEGTARSYTFIDSKKKEHKFTKASFNKLLENTEIKNELYDKLSEVMISKYRSSELSEDQIVKTDEQMPD